MPRKKISKIALVQDTPAAEPVPAEPSVGVPVIDEAAVINIFQAQMRKAKLRFNQDFQRLASVAHTSAIYSARTHSHESPRGTEECPGCKTFRRNLEVIKRMIDFDQLEDS